MNEEEIEKYKKIIAFGDYPDYALNKILKTCKCIEDKRLVYKEQYNKLGLLYSIAHRNFNNSVIENVKIGDYTIENINVESILDILIKSQKEMLDNLLIDINNKIVNNLGIPEKLI